MKNSFKMYMHMWKERMHKRAWANSLGAFLDVRSDVGKGPPQNQIVWVLPWTHTTSGKPWPGPSLQPWRPEQMPDIRTLASQSPLPLLLAFQKCQLPLPEGHPSEFQCLQSSPCLQQLLEPRGQSWGHIRGWACVLCVFVCAHTHTGVRVCGESGQ